MITGISNTDICNAAIGIVGGEMISAYDDASDISVESRLCRLFFSLMRQTVIESRMWSFATERRRLVQVVVEDELQDAHPGMAAFALPAGTLFVNRVTSDAQGRNDTEWSLERNVVWAEGTTTAYATILVDEVDPTKWSPSFANAMASRLSMKLAIPLSNSKEILQLTTQLFQAEVQSASTLDALQGKNRPMADGRLIRVR